MIEHSTCDALAIAPASYDARTVVHPPPEPRTAVLSRKGSTALAAVAEGPPVAQLHPSDFDLEDVTVLETKGAQTCIFWDAGKNSVWGWVESPRSRSAGAPSSSDLVSRLLVAGPVEDARPVAPPRPARRWPSAMLVLAVLACGRR